jgi:RNA polymerase sigma factor (sigma-70 family)
MLELTDNELIQAYLAGNTNAFGKIVVRYKDKIFTSIYLLTKDKCLSEDIFQEVFIKIIDTINNGRYNEEGKFLPWAMRIAHNMCIDYFRKVKRTPVITTSEDTDIFEALNFLEPSAEDKIMLRDRNQALYRMLDKLQPDQKEVIVLRHFSDLSFKEIATLTNCSINTALGRMRYGIINLQKLMLQEQHHFS